MSLISNFNQEEIGSLQIEDKTIIAQVIPLRNINYEKNFSKITRQLLGSELYGILRSKTASQIHVTYTDPIYLTVIFNDLHEPVEHYKIALSEYMNFMNEYVKGE